MIKNMLAFLTSYKAKKAELDNLETELKAMKKEIIAHAEETGIVPDETGKIKFTHGQYIVTITEKTRTGIDKTGLENNYPDIAKQFETITTYPEVRVK